MKILFDTTKEAKFYITEKGDVFSLKRGKYYKRKTNVNRKRGYTYIRTSKGNYQVHRIVALSFIENKENKPCINHKDGNKQNNNVKNLEWVTYKENSAHSIKNGFVKFLKKNEGNIKYTNEQCKKVLERVKRGMIYVEAGSIFNMPYSTVAHLARGSRRKI